MTPEGKVEAYLIARVKATGGRQRKLQWIGRRGAPDRMVWWPGPNLHFVEVKRAGGRLHPLQVVEGDRLRADGFRVWVVASREEVDAFIELALDGQLTSRDTVGHDLDP
jgi:hypothetical protein